MHADALKQRATMSNDLLYRSVSVQPIIAFDEALQAKTRRADFTADGCQENFRIEDSGRCQENAESGYNGSKESTSKTGQGTVEGIDKSPGKQKILDEAAFHPSSGSAEAMGDLSTTMKASKEAFGSVSEDDNTDNSPTVIYKSTLAQAKGAGAGAGAESSFSESSSKHSHKSVTFSDHVIVNEIEGRSRRVQYRRLPSNTVVGNSSDEESSDEEAGGMDGFRDGTTPPRRELRSKRSIWSTDEDDYFEEGDEEQESKINETEGSNGMYLVLFQITYS